MSYECKRLSLEYEILAQKLLRLAPKAGLYESPIAGLGYARRDDPERCENVLFPPCMGLVVQGSKDAVVGSEKLRYAQGQYILCCVDMPSSFTVSGTKDNPFLTVSFRLDFDLLADIFRELDAAELRARENAEPGENGGEAAGEAETARAPSTNPHGFPRAIPRAEESASLSRFSVDDGSASVCGEHASFVAEARPELLNAFLRLIDLLDRPEDRPFLEPLISREIHYYLASGPGGPLLRTFLEPQTLCGLIARAITYMRTHCRDKCRIEELARMVNMAESTFNRNFKKVTSLSPLQYHKHLKLFEARRLMRRGYNAAAACAAVGYESQQQFTREYKRLFGYPPVKDTRRGLN